MKWFMSRKKRKEMIKEMKSSITELVREGCPHCKGEFHLFEARTKEETIIDGYSRYENSTDYLIKCSKCKFILYQTPRYEPEPIETHRFSGDGWRLGNFSLTVCHGWKKATYYDFSSSMAYLLERFIEKHKFIPHGFCPSERDKIMHLQYMHLQ
jgi:hypothetical protein